MHDFGLLLGRSVLDSLNFALGQRKLVRFFVVIYHLLNHTASINLERKGDDVLLNYYDEEVSLYLRSEIE
jgi:hypothetical protein